ncbi:MAG TPA: hypothetical protein VHB50_12365 [Bryobacteraceae bacterium]|nr:hypothetical protein [Bryobacteraceae bacterium]
MVEDLIRRARRRIVVNETMRQLAFACAMAIAGIALVLLLGTRYLEWWTVALFAAAGLIAGLARIWRAVPGEYATAVRLDRDARLSDALSTAFYFSSHRTSWPEFQRQQREQAEAAAARISLDEAVPFTFPRALYAMAALTLLASGLVFLRYNVSNGLNLRPPLTEVLFEDLAAKQIAKKQPGMDPARRKRLESAESLLAKLGVPINPDEQKMPEAALDKAIEQALERPAAPNDKGQKGASSGKSENGKPGNGLQQSPDGDPLDGKSSEGDQAGDNKSPGRQDSPAGDKGNAKNNNGDGSPGLMSRLKDAVSNMFSKARQDDNKSGQKNGQEQQAQAGKSDKSGGEKGNSGKGQDPGQNQADAQDGEPSGEAQEGQQAQGKAGSKSSQQSAQAGSGVGSQDGAKDLRAAEQLKAMGKISEIIGKRAATVTGETTIEVQSGNQQLRTAYSSNAASHGEADSDVSRDEIPVSLQSYVQQYFEQVRKSAPPAKSSR